MLKRSPAQFERAVWDKRRKGSISPERSAEWRRYALDRAAFIRDCCHIYDGEARAWIPFDLWPAQEDALALLGSEPKLVILKARQLGLTWLVIAWFLSEMLFAPIANVLLFSRRETEAKYLLERLAGMYSQLPPWAREMAPTGTPANTLTWSLANGSTARAFPSNVGDSYTATHALADEFDLVAEQEELLGAVQPTVDAGGQLILLSRVDKSRPTTEFKRIYQAATRGESKWRALFLPWHARPSRGVEWYEAQRRDYLSRTGALDSLHEQYPATDMEALAPNALDKRIPYEWLARCYSPSTPLSLAGVEGAPAIPGLHVYSLPDEGRAYVMGADPAEGNPTSDDSALDVVDKETGEQVATLSGKVQPDVLAAHIKAVGTWYNRASVLPERNNHGHAVISWLRSNEYGDCILRGTDAKRGWLTTAASKALAYDEAAVAFREGDALLHSEKTFLQLASIGGSSLEAPAGLMDDAAMSYVLAQRARVARRSGGWA